MMVTLMKMTILTSDHNDSKDNLVAGGKTTLEVVAGAKKGSEKEQRH